MSSTYIDFEIQKNIFSTNEAKSIFDEKSRLQRWLIIEATLAETQAEFGVIPIEAANEIKKVAQIENLDLNKIKEEYEKSRNSLLPLLKILGQFCANGHGEYVHYGVTTQDIIDTGQALEIKEMLNIVYRDSRTVENELLKIAQQYSKTPMIGRTHGQYALPITFGLKVAVWLTEIRRHIERIKSLSERILVGQLSGAVGTYSGLGDKAQEISKITLKKLGLSYSPVAWHTARDNICELSMVFSMLVNTLAKIANEIYQLSKSDTLEMKESSVSTTALSSSAMPHKSNPVLAERIVVLSKHVRALSNVMSESMIHEGERDPRSLWAEWLSIPQLCIYTASSLDNMIKLLQGLQIFPENMILNLNNCGENIFSEYLMLKLSKHIGKIRAQEKLHEFSILTHNNDISLKELLISDNEIAKYISDEDFEAIEKPESYLGQSEEIVALVLNDIYLCRNNENDLLIT
jgi:adenylosuccinate lyase